MNLSQGQRYFLKAWGGFSLAGVFLFLFRALWTDTSRYSFIPGNLALAWAGLLFGWGFALQLKRRTWSNWQTVLSGVLWLFFLPNTWYTLTDFLHVYPTGEISQLYDIILVSGLVFCGFALGFASLFSVHKQLRVRMGARNAYLLAELALLLSSFAIFLGRVLRWNSWDVLTNPGGLIQNVSDRVIDPFAHPYTLNSTMLFFVFLSACYWVFFWSLAAA